MSRDKSKFWSWLLQLMTFVRYYWPPTPAINSCKLTGPDSRPLHQQKGPSPRSLFAIALIVAKRYSYESLALQIVLSLVESSTNIKLGDADWQRPGPSSS